MAAVAHEAVGDEAQGEEEGGDVAEPDVVHGYGRGERQGALEDFAAEGHAAAEVAVAHEEVVPATFVLAHHAVERGGELAEPGIDDGAVAHDAGDFAQGGHHDADLVGLPDVVLVAEEDVVALGVAEGVLEVEHGRTLARTFDNAHVGTAQGADLGEGGVGGAVVGHDDFVALAELGQDGGYLLADVGGSVVGGYANGYHGLAVGSLRYRRK